MTYTRLIYSDGLYRIVEYVDVFFDIEDLMGDCFNLELHPDVSPEVLDQERNDFADEVNREGVYGYVLEKWNPDVGAGWETIDSCWGFVGRYSDTEERYKHYIVAGMVQHIAELEKERAQLSSGQGRLILINKQG